MLPIPYELRKHKHSELAAQQSSFWTIRINPAIFASCQARLRSSPSEISLAIASQVRQSFLPHKSAEFWLKQECMNKKQAMFLKNISLTRFKFCFNITISPQKLTTSFFCPWQIFIISKLTPSMGVSTFCLMKLVTMSHS